MTSGRRRVSGTLGKAATVALATIAMVLGAAAVASADRNINVSMGGHLRGTASFIAEGDWLRICDKRQDNLPVAVRYSYLKKNHQVQRGTLFHTAGMNGFGTPGPLGRTRGCSYGNHNFAENSSVWLQACVRDSGANLTCSPTVKTGT